MFDDTKQEPPSLVAAADAAALHVAGFSNTFTPFSALLFSQQTSDGVEKEANRLLQKLIIADTFQLKDSQAEVLKKLQEFGAPMEQKLSDLLESGASKSQTRARLADVLQEYKKPPVLDSKSLESCMQDVFSQSSCARELIAIKDVIAPVIQTGEGRSISELVDIENQLRHSDPDIRVSGKNRILLSEVDRNDLIRRQLDVEKALLISLSESFTGGGYSISIKQGDSRTLNISRVDKQQGKLEFQLLLGKTVLVMPAEHKLERLVRPEQTLRLEAENEYGRITPIEAATATRFSDYLRWLAVSPALEFRVTDPEKFRLRATHHLDLNDRPNEKILRGLGIAKDPFRNIPKDEESL